MGGQSVVFRDGRVGVVSIQLCLGSQAFGTLRVGKTEDKEKGRSMVNSKHGKTFMQLSIVCPTTPITGDWEI